MNAPIALGFGDNVDYEIAWDSAVFEALIARYAIGAGELAADPPIASERELVISILRFLASGTGGERFVASSEVIEPFAQRFAKKITLGGTSVRAAIAMRTLGYTSALHLVTVNEHVRRLIPPDSPYVCSSAADTLYPHLIVQFDKGAHVRAGDIDITARRANRIIYHNDTDNITMRLNEEFARLITQAQALLISGFNAMQREDLLLDRLAAVRRMLAALPAGACVFFEDAAFYNPRFSTLIQQALADTITVYSLNEDELQAHAGRPVDVLDAAQVEAALASLHRLIPAPILVVHSMHWALAYGPTAPRYRPALAGGVTMATTRFCHGDDFTAREYSAVAALPPTADGARFAAAITQRLGDRVCCVPVAHVEQSKATTVGLGDAFVGGFLAALVGA
ncbi:MAG: ADP-dependent glucokinase/phosphofructokinase [Caldilinea sp.]|nr:hypothetical protein [Caldilineaceae bacterium]MCO5212183.1 ADP-dependent glucokinase/phosphofructokinase [Caldilinea sp.]